MSTWCNGCKAGEPHYKGDIPDYYGHDCEHYHIRPIDQVVADEIAEEAQIQTVRDDHRLAMKRMEFDSWR
jgi:hypothetical protein